MRDAVTIRPSRPEDFEAWFLLFEEVAAEGRWIGAEAPVDRDWARRSFERHVDADTSVMLLAESHGQHLGHLGVTLAGGCADIGMMVRIGHRGRGIGSALLDAGIEWARAKTAHKVTLLVWPHNEPAIALYEKYGFVVEGRLARHWRRRNGQLWDAVPMGLVLDTTSPGSPFDDNTALAQPSPRAL